MLLCKAYAYLTPAKHGFKAKPYNRSKTHVGANCIHWCTVERLHKCCYCSLGALPYLQDDLLQQDASTPAASSWVTGTIVSSAVAGAGCGSAVGGWISDHLGRKKALLMGDLLFAAGALFMAAAINTTTVIIGRVIVGLGIGLASVTAPIYIAECSPSSMRAALVSANVLMITTGQFTAYLVNYCFTFVPGTWRWMLGVGALPALVQAVGLFMLPESPKWLACKGNLQLAKQSLLKLRPESEVEAVWQELLTDAGCSTQTSSPAHVSAASGIEHDNHNTATPRHVQGYAGDTGSHQDRSQWPDHESGNDGDDDDAGYHGNKQMPCNAAPKPSVNIWSTLRRPEVQLELKLGIGLQVLQQLAGINTIMYYTPVVLTLAGITSKRTALLVSLAPAAVNASGTIVGMWAIDRFGRRRLLLSSTMAVAFSLLLLGAAFELSVAAAAAACDTSNSGSRKPSSGTGSSIDCTQPHAYGVLICMILYLAAFAPGLGPVPWAVNAEIYPTDVRGLGAGLAATANWLTNAVVSQTFLVMTQVSRLAGRWVGEGGRKIMPQ